jgi:hypothetical protein
MEAMFSSEIDDGFAKTYPAEEMGLKEPPQVPVLDNDFTRERALHNTTKRQLLDMQKKIVDLQNELLSHKNKQNVNESPDIIDTEHVPISQDARTKGPVIGRDLVTGADITFSSCEQAAYSCGITPAAMRRTILNKPRQLKGRHWYTPGKPHWSPPTGLVYDPEIFETSTKGYIKAFNDNETRIYESITSAARYLDINRRSLTDFVGNVKYFHGFLWTELPFTQWGTWYTDEQEPPKSSTVVSVVSNNGINGRCNGKIISRDLVTGNEVIYESNSKAAASHGMSPHALRNYIDKPRHAFGKHFRSFNATRYWTPPINFKYNAETCEIKSNGYIISIDETGKQILYESVNAAVKIENIPKWTITQFKDTGKTHDHRTWKTAALEDYDIFTTISV